MTKVDSGGWLLEVDQEATLRGYATIASGAPESCGCVPCRNFASARDVAYPLAALELYKKLGITPDREAETYEAGRPESGSLRCYGGWHHFVGRILERHDGDVEIAPGFRIWFQESRSLANQVFERAGSVVQAEFLAKVPWVLAEPPPRGDTGG